MNAAGEYDQDFYLWLMSHAALLRKGKFSEVDTEHIAEELETMGKKEQRELISRLSVLLAHLLKWAYFSLCGEPEAGQTPLPRSGWSCLTCWRTAPV